MGGIWNYGRNWEERRTSVVEVGFPVLTGTYIYHSNVACLKFIVFSPVVVHTYYVLLSISEHIKVPHRSISVMSDSIVCDVCIFKPTAASHGDVYLVFLSFLGSVAMINSHFPATIYSAPHLSIQETPRRCLCTCHRLPRGGGGGGWGTPGIPGAMWGL